MTSSGRLESLPDSEKFVMFYKKCLRRERGVSANKISFGARVYLLFVLLMAVAASKHPMSRAQRETRGVVTSAGNLCVRAGLGVGRSSSAFVCAGRAEGKGAQGLANTAKPASRLSVG